MKEAHGITGVRNVKILALCTALQQVCSEPARSPLGGHSLKKRKQGIAVLEKAVIMKRGKIQHEVLEYLMNIREQN